MFDSHHIAVADLCPQPINASSLRERGVFVIVAALAIALTTGCQSSVDEDRDAIQLQLNWFPDAQHGGFYAAADIPLSNGAQLEVLPGGPAAPVIQQVTTRQVDFAVANADQILMARAQGAPVVAVLAAMQHSPRCIMVHRQSNITSFDELNNMTLALGTGKAFANFLQQQLPLTDVQIVPYTGSIAMFLQDHRFGQQGYIFSEPYVARSRGADPVMLMVSDLGFDPYSSCLITHEEVIAQHPDRVQAVVAAACQGWRDYLENPTEVNRRIVAINSEMDVDSLAYGAEALRSLCIPENAPPSNLGTMSAARWEQLADQLVALGLMESSAGSAEAFTSDFLTAATEQIENSDRQPAAPPQSSP